ncbi:MAG: hypothetical protein Metus_0304 [Candidatus Methanosuratincola subterraneus]|uniref:Uncharacterized protein n=1 Tax=Methanosuratincola subterraneus TaxID=2593994 RepID=A0A3S3ST84_METS7|nr:MAG: hypothetical protein Metus_0304 [Candidatus Methanosuratincola subterraneus]
MTVLACAPNEYCLPVYFYIEKLEGKFKKLHNLMISFCPAKKRKYYNMHQFNLI